MEHQKKILLSFDVEEFDAPTEYNIKIPVDKQFSISFYGLKKILNILDDKDIKSTFFTTASFAKKYPDLIKDISSKHEIASHGFDHKEVTEEGINSSKTALELITGKEVIGFRSPRLQSINGKILQKYGYKYNSSENPIFLPGRYNNFFKKRTAYFDKSGILNIPASASPLIRFPLFWLAFKNFPLSVTKVFSSWTLNFDKYLNIYFHPWEFSDISEYKIPKVMNRICSDVMINKFIQYINFLDDKADFITLKEFYNLKSNENN